MAVHHHRTSFRAVLSNSYAGFPDDVDRLRIRRLREGGQEGEVYAERLVGHIVAARDLSREQFERLSRESGDDVQATGVGGRRRKLGKSDIMHTALNDRIFDAEEIRDPCLHS